MFMTSRKACSNGRGAAPAQWLTPSKKRPNVSKLPRCMRALRFDQTGSLDALKVSDIPKPAPGPNEVLVEVKAAAVNPSDIKNVLGGMHETTVPRTPGRDFAGTVVAGPPQLLGQSVFGSGGDLGFRRDASHAQFLAVPEVAAVPKPATLDPVRAAAIG